MTAPTPWLEALRSRVRGHAGPTVVEADPRWGVPHLIDALGKLPPPLVWVELSPSDQNDPVAQGNKLAEAVQRALGSPLFGYAMPYRYGLGILRRHLELLSPLTLVVSHAEHGPGFAQDLLELNKHGSLVVLHFCALPAHFALPPGALRLGPDQLRLSQAEALALSEGRLADEEVIAQWQAADGAYEPFMVALHQRLSLPVPLRPGPEGPRLPPGHQAAVEPETLLKHLGQRGRWLQALELAVELLPERAPQVLGSAGLAYLERGMSGRLWQLLTRLPPEVAASEAVLYWRLSAASRLGLDEQMRQPVEAYLKEHQAPELRALYALVLAPPETALSEAERAFSVAKTPLTLFAYGWQLCTTDPDHGVKILQESVKLAEQGGRTYEIARNAGALAGSLMVLGRYREAAHWAGWALEQFDRAGLADATRRLHIVNDWAYARILLGDTAGLEDLLKEGEAHLSEVSRDLVRVFRSTLGDFYLAAGQPEKALNYYLQNWEEARRDMVGLEASNLVRALLELGQTSQAQKVAERAYTLTKGQTFYNAHRALLAHGMALSLVDPAQALPPLQAAYRAFQNPLDADLLAQAGLYLARTQLLLGSAEEARATLEGASAGLNELGEAGLHFRAGPRDAFASVFGLLSPHHPPLELRFLGGSEARQQGKPLALRQSFCELLATLVLHPEGLSAEQLLLQMYGEEGSASNLKSAISKLRRKVPIASWPYRLELAVWADFVELEQHLREGRVRQAVSLYRGPLLPGSDRPGIVEAREVLEEQLRQAVLTSGDAEALLELAERLGEDLQLWEAALAALHSADPRLPLVRARFERIRRAWARGG
jgi:tetratricopeptide (TPR) repeat protein